MTVSSGTLEGTFALVAINSSGSSGAGATEANWFTVVDPSSTTISACGVADVVEATYQLDPLNPNSCATGTSLPLTGEDDGIIFSVFNNSEGGQPVPAESDGILFSVQNNAGSGSAKKTSARPADRGFKNAEGTGPKSGPASQHGVLENHR
ncbi:MAG TPA: hypothetical protein VIX19_03545 [Terriglobales bacterium]